MAKKKKKKHDIKIPPKGPQSEQYLKKRKKKLNIKLGLNPESMKDLGYKYKLGKIQKVLFVTSICLGMMPFWFILERKEYAQSLWRSARAFLFNLSLWVLIVLLIVFWKDISGSWNSLFKG